MTFIGRVVGEVELQLGAVKEVIVPPATLKEVDLVFVDRPYPVKLMIDRDPAGQVADIVAAVQYLQVRELLRSISMSAWRARRFRSKTTPYRYGVCSIYVLLVLQEREKGKNIYKYTFI